MATAKEKEEVDINDQEALQAAVNEADFGGSLFEDDSTIPESNWFKFAEVGDSIEGKLVMEPYETQGKFGLQTVFVIQKANGDEFNVALKNDTNKRAVQSLRKAQVGDIIAFKRGEDVDTGKGFPAHPIEVRHRPMS